MKIEAYIIDELPVAGFMCLKSMSFYYIGCHFSHPRPAVIACVLTLPIAIVLIFACIYVIYTFSREVRRSGPSESSYKAVECLC
jgi:hypothetical protein